MKVQVKDLEKNPFRDMQLVPIDLESVALLKESIECHGLWEGMAARPKNNDWDCGKYEIPYGHHRLQAIRELGIVEIEIPVYEISDSEMVLRMVRENMTQRGLSVEMINGTIMEVQKYLDGELAKYERWETSDESIKRLIDKYNFDKAKQQGVGRTTILKFLKGSIKQWRIQDALNTINDPEISIEAVNILPTTNASEKFKKAIKSVNKKRKSKGKEPLTDTEQKRLAEVINNTIIPGSNGIERKNGYEDLIIKETEGDDAVLEVNVNDIVLNMADIYKAATRLEEEVIRVNTDLKELGVEGLENFYFIMDAVSSFGHLFSSVATMFNYFGIDFKNEVKKIQNQ